MVPSGGHSDNLTVRKEDTGGHGHHMNTETIHSKKILRNKTGNERYTPAIATAQRKLWESRSLEGRRL